MTTLPTTTPMRLPRPAGAGPLALGGPGQPGFAQSNASPMNGADVWRVIRSNLWLIIALLVLSSVAGYLLNRYLWRYHRSYTAVGFVEVNPTINMDLIRRTPVTMDVNSLQMEQRTQAAMLSQTALFNQVLQDSNSQLRTTNWWKSFNGDLNEAKEELEDDFRVDVIPESKLISIRMSYKDAKDCRIIVEDIVNQHLENQRGRTLNKELERSAVLQRGADEIEALVRDQPVQPRLLQPRVVVVVHVVETEHLVAAFQQALAEVGADEAGRAGDEYAHVLFLYAGSGRITGGADYRLSSAARADA